MSQKEFVTQMKRCGKGRGLGYFNGIAKKASMSKSKSTDFGRGALGKARVAKKDGATASFRDLLDPKRLARFKFCYVKGKGSKQEIIGPVEGTLFWTRGYLQTRLNGDDAIQFKGKDNGLKGNQASPYVATHLPIKYLPSDGSEPVELGTVLGGGLEKLFPKPTTWVRISGIFIEIERSDVKEQLKEALQDDEDEAIVRVERNAGISTSAGSFDVQFAKVWEARGCVTLLDENKSLFGSKITVELLYES